MGHLPPPTLAQLFSNGIVSCAGTLLAAPPTPHRLVSEHVGGL